MKVNNKYFSLFFKIILVLIAGYGLVINIFIGDLSVILEQLTYFTVLSNLFCFILFIYLIINIIKNFDNYDKIKPTKIRGLATTAIIITFLTFHFRLRPDVLNGLINYDISSLRNVIAHYVVPFMVVADWLLFEQKGNYGFKDPLKWLIVPMVYCLLIFLNAKFGYTYESGSNFPYTFLDMKIYGFDIIIYNLLTMLISIVVIFYTFIIMDKLLKKIK